MVFSDDTGKAGIIQDIDFLLFGSSTFNASYTLLDRTRNANRRMEEAVSAILQSDNTWEFDDSNFTDLPIGTTSLVNGQNDYNIPGSNFIKIIRVECMDSSGNYRQLTPMSEKEVNGQAMTEFMKTPGMPVFYDKIGDSLFLYPTPSSSLVTLSAGLKVYYQRPPSYFESTDTTKTPGFNPLYHRMISVGAALDYAIANGMNSKINVLSPMFSKLEQGLMNSYAQRVRDEGVRMRLKNEDFTSENVPTGYSQSDKQPYMT